MSLIKSMRRQKAVYWKRTGVDEYGNPSFLGPVEIDCRWEDTLLDYRYAQGALSGSQSNVYVDRIMAIGDYLAEGVMGPGIPANPRDLPTAYEILAFEKIPNMRATETLLIAHLGGKKGGFQ